MRKGKLRKERQASSSCPEPHQLSSGPTGLGLLAMKSSATMPPAGVSSELVAGLSKKIGGGGKSNSVKAKVDFYQPAPEQAGRCGHEMEQHPGTSREFLDKYCSGDGRGQGRGQGGAVSGSRVVGGTYRQGTKSPERILEKIRRLKVGEREMGDVAEEVVLRRGEMARGEAGRRVGGRWGRLEGSESGGHEEGEEVGVERGRRDLAEELRGLFCEE